MADQHDRAQQMDARYLKMALEKHAKSARPSGTSRYTCIYCGAKIPEARREVIPGCVDCVSCASVHEKPKGES